MSQEKRQKMFVRTRVKPLTMNLKLYQCSILLVLWICLMGNLRGQSEFPMSLLSFDDLSAFQPTQQNWKVVGVAEASLEKQKSISTRPGTGILINQPDDKNKAQLFSGFDHGDIDLDFEVMLPAGSNSGIYLQGRYEIQLLDSWGKKRPTFGDLGGIYQRWNEEKPEGQKGYEGTAPRVNAAKAPGLWQHMRISFNAPRFDGQGQKIQNARINYIELNGITIHQNVELTGPTRGAYVGEGNESPLGPLVIQGDHGAVAFRNFRYRSFDGKPIQMKNLAYKVMRGKLKKAGDWSEVKPVLQGEDRLITWSVAQADNDFTTLHTGELEVPAAGDYLFELTCQGVARLWVGEEKVLDIYSARRSQVMTLAKGSIPFHLEYEKEEVWRQGQLGLSIEGGKFRPVRLNYESSALISNPTNPIFEKPGNETRLLRSFVDFKMPHMAKSKKITNAINVGNPNGLHYTYDLKLGSLVQVWRGDFLDMTPMWDNRGNGVSRALGVKVLLTADAQLMKRQEDGQLSLDYAEGTYLFRSYKVDAENQPTFYYQAYGLEVMDQLMPQENRKSIQRSLQFKGKANGDLFFCLATGNTLAKVDKDLYRVNDQYYLQTSNTTKVENLADGRQALIVSLKGQNSLNYSILW